MRRRLPANLDSGWTLQPSTEPVVANVSTQSHFLVEGHNSGLGSVHPILTINSFTTWSLPFSQEEDIVIRNGWTPEEREREEAYMYIFYAYTHMYPYI